MARGILSGLIAGAVVSGVTAGGVSLSLGLPERLTLVSMEKSVVPEKPVTTDKTAVADKADGEMTPGEKVTTGEKPAAAPEPARRPGTVSPVESGETPVIDAPERVAPANIGTDITASAPVPSVDSVIDAPDSSPGISAGSDIAIQPDAPVALVPLAENVPLPGAEAELSISTNPAQPPAPAPTETTPIADKPVPDIVVTSDAEPESNVVEVAPSAPETVEPVAPPVVEIAVAQPPQKDATVPKPAPVEGLIRRPSTDEGAGRSIIGRPVGSLIDRESSVPIGRLPTIGVSDAAVSAPDPSETVFEVASDESLDGTPLQRYAKPVVVAGDLPRISVILIHDTSTFIGPQAVDAFPLPVTFAVDASLPDAIDVMRGYRQRGFEVLALANVPAAAIPSDVEVALQAALSAVPEAVGVLEGTGDGFQSTRAISDQVTAILFDSGHGLVMQPKGLNTAQALAAKEGVPSATVFRDFDGQGQDGRVIRRFLDQAIFRARQETDGVIMLGRMTPDTISSLLLWGLQDKASTVALVPVSMVLAE